MRGMRWFPLVSCLLLILAPVAAYAQGTITGLSASPSSPNVDQDTVITVQGTGFCKKLQVDFGDGSEVEKPQDVDFGNNVNVSVPAHKFSPADTYTVTATPLKECNGQATLNLTVGGSGGGGQVGPGIFENKDLLCKILDNCDPKLQVNPDVYKLIVQTPIVEGIFPFSVFEPAGAVIVTGQRFGSTKGELHMYLKTDKRDIKLTVDTWGPGGIGAKIPWGTFGVVDQKGEFYVKTSNGIESNRYGNFSFTARRALRSLPRSDVELGFFGCGTASDCDSCMGGGDPDDGCFSSIPQTGTVSGYHWQNCGLIGNDVDHDTYNLKTPLKNSWVLDKAFIHNTVDPGEGSASASLTSSQIKVNWSISPCDGISYYVNVYVKGPTGTAHK